MQMEVHGRGSRLAPPSSRVGLKTDVALCCSCERILSGCLTLFLLFLLPEFRPVKSLTWLRWAAGGCSSPTVMACLKCSHHVSRRVWQTWVWACNLSVCLVGTDLGAARRQSHSPLPPRFRPARPQVSAVQALFPQIVASQPNLKNARVDLVSYLSKM